MEWLKMVLENAEGMVSSGTELTPGFVYVLSLKGSILYVSPSIKRVLGYDSGHLVDKNISDLCHPLDIVPLMRELKDFAHAPTDGPLARPVNLVFRIRCQESEYVWIECSGRLYVEPGKSRKAVILSGWTRNVSSLQWSQVANNGGLGEVEFWSKLSHQGLIIYLTSTVNGVLGKRAEDVIGQSFFSLLPGGNNGPPKGTDWWTPDRMASSALQLAMAGDIRSGGTAIQHQMVQKSGRQVEVVSVFYDANGASAAGCLAMDISITRKRSNHVVVQTKVILEPVVSTTSLAQATRSKPVVHPPATNVFEELETPRRMSWQYELHQLRALNRSLRADIAASRSALESSEAKRRKKRWARQLYRSGTVKGDVSIRDPFFDAKCMNIDRS